MKLGSPWFVLHWNGHWIKAKRNGSMSKGFYRTGKTKVYKLWTTYKRKMPHLSRNGKSGRSNPDVRMAIDQTRSWREGLRRGIKSRKRRGSKKQPHRS